MNKVIEYIRNKIGFQALILWTLVFILAFPHNLWISVKLSFVVAVVTLVSVMTVYYFNQKVLIPRLMLKGRKGTYIFSCIIMLLVMVNLSAHLETTIYYMIIKEPIADIMRDGIPFYEYKDFFSTSKYVALLTMSFALSSIVTFGQKAKETVRQKEELLSERKTLEARVLKSQINSHFVFNALNNIYSMTYFKDEYTSGYVLKLAQMMRYLMEDCETELTPLIKDIEYIENFIDFQKLRFECAKDISFSCRVDENAALSIPPMIFQPLVENCFKHTPLEVDKNSYIHISMEADADKVYFVAENSQPMIKQTTVAKDPGIGIENVKRRLDIYYDDNYKLDISNTPDSFRVQLSITFTNPKDSYERTPACSYC
ncbi:two-component system LytT family sensor kinase [Parabacteroides sp. PF5-5]|uniref:sensor histidine kinase n=1 Tax=unclassified Parabacteroides TaxID=2649774 RepID=UPI002474C7F4|nr:MULTISPECIES: histidine kinase [unclassified Parabacteroides]MDH6304742.1 two-component system LytT family sensor kinase [Parabacteroides sp. PH5-39]MDH6315643.1 two-component system LytT family sensor kinase [Parabacteroides sp. PF5-13]MDH6319304.1 two-component system LytT family sensor kinase [Parabacteroides sp. PH5-13]MDH6323035.1 two-component system LytT family sensor kinase [Parabacteroides sp. PH5-8]MDH6326836.1 two-component system LytT family sensor kinase [Parabacteroides sp. PH